MEDIFVVKRCNKIIIHGRRASDSQHDPAEAKSWFRICDTRTNGFIGDGYDVEEDARRECSRLNAVSSTQRPDSFPADTDQQRAHTKIC